MILNVYECQFVHTFFLKILFIYSQETQRERQRHRQREKQALCWEPDVGLDPRTPRTRPELKADAQLLSPPGIPGFLFSDCVYLTMRGSYVQHLLTL